MVDESVAPLSVCFESCPIREESLLEDSALDELGDSVSGTVTCCSLTGAFAVAEADLEIEFSTVSKVEDGSDCELRVEPPDLLLFGTS